MTKQTLLAITGLSPQVVTETLYGIHQNPSMQWPDEIVILTTEKGKEQARLGLLTDRKNGNGSMLNQCCQDLNRPCFNEAAVQIMVVPDHLGNPIDDARSNEDQEALADYIVKTVARLCNDDSRKIHASLAGGRKTMTFYLGYAMSLFARANDTLSHVLISKSEYEGLRDFYYPTSYHQSIAGRGENNFMDTHQDNISVTLADIPFIRQREQLSKNLLETFSSDKNDITYRDLVKIQNIASNCTDPYHDIKLNFDMDMATIDIEYKGEKVYKTLNMVDKPLEMAFFAMVARHNSVHSKQRYFRNLAPQNGDDAKWEDFMAQWNTFVDLYVKELYILVKPCLDMNARGDSLLEKWQDSTSNETKGVCKIEAKTIDTGLNNPTPKKPNPVFFDDRKKNLKKFLEESLPADLVKLLLPDTVFMGKNGEFRKALSGKAKDNTPSNYLGLKVSSNLCEIDK